MGRSRVYLGVHFANDDFQGQTLGLSVADSIFKDQKDPAATNIKSFDASDKTIPTTKNLKSVFVSNSAQSGFYGFCNITGIFKR
jgi:hypothetical protein